MVAPSPDNADTGWSYSSGYQYRAAKHILGFSNTHISGAGINELGDVLLQAGQRKKLDGHHPRFFQPLRQNQRSAPSPASMACVATTGCRVELTTSQRVAFQRYRFDQPNGAQVLVDFQHGLKFMHDDRVSRKRHCHQRGAAPKSAARCTRKAGSTRQYSFVLRFDQPFTARAPLPARAGEKAPRYVLNFRPGADRMLEARIAFSTVDVAGARRNLAVVDGKNFDARAGRGRGAMAEPAGARPH